MATRPDPAAYRRAQAKARRAARRLSASSVREMRRALRQYSQEIISQLARIRTGKTINTGQRAAILKKTSDIVNRAAERLSAKMVEIVEQHRNASFAEISEIYRKAMIEATDAAGLSAAVSKIGVPAISMAAAYESIGGAAATFRTLLPQYAAASGREVNAIIRGALMQNIGPDKLARRLRPYVEGIQDFEQAIRGIKGINIEDLRTVLAADIPDARKRKILNAAKKMRHNAERIAFTETYNARAEAEVQHYINDPLVEAAKWVRSPDRGTSGGSCQCDAYALTDFYGMGPGIYPVYQIPMPPHPWCRCDRVPIMRKFADIGKPKPNPDRIRSGSEAKLPKGITRPEAARVRESTEASLTRGPGVQKTAA